MIRLNHCFFFDFFSFPNFFQMFPAAADSKQDQQQDQQF